MFEPLANALGGQNDDNSSSSESKDEYIHRIGNVEWLVAFYLFKRDLCCLMASALLIFDLWRVNGRGISFTPATSRALDSVGLMRLQYKTSFIKSLTYPEKQIIIYVGFALHFEKRKNGYVLVQKESPLGGNL
ncbi:uncharacterized protein LOC124436978 isoform X1 [Xenia sp. Carnegie-2017]|uniref:uncharacterized protein LOC124436978 isoform X1 n=1 Tax=Xenia sp. Carnegie-2017 TaxID=2897299 RepID=UPI001F03E09A|nr:uncharacterized protein LOC124436978 isoform X1 [Xenia sp. Carnegie-2017]